MKHIQKIGTPDPSKIVVEEKTLKEITEMDKYGYFKIVKIKDVYFTGYDSDGKKLNDEILPFPSDGKNVTAALAKYALNPIFAPSTYSADKKYNIGFPRSRVIADDSGVAFLPPVATTKEKLLRLRGGSKITRPMTELGS